MRRSDYIGGADAATLLKKTPYGDIWTAWAKKTGRVLDDPDNHHMARGNTMEPVIANYVRGVLDTSAGSAEIRERFGTPESFTAWTNWLMDGKEGPEPQMTVLHSKYPFVGGHPDDVGKQIVWEYKAPAMRNFDMLVKSGLHEYWLIQNQHYLWVLESLKHPAREGRIVVWDYDEWRPMITRVRPDRRLWSQFEKIYPAFWWCVEMDEQPSIAGYEDALAFVDDAVLDALLGEYEANRKAKGNAMGAEKHLKGQIMTYLAGRPQIRTANFTAAIKPVKRFGNVYDSLIVRGLNAAEPEVEED